MTTDELYQLPLPEFTAARNALAKTLKGDEAKDVRALVKPTVLPWAVNQVFWHARPLYDKVLDRGKTLRTAQLAALKGQKADVRAATDAHKKAISDAVKRASELAAKHNVKPEAEPLARMFEVLSLAATHPETPGRLTEILQPQGFESLAGITTFAKAPASRPTAVPDAVVRATSAKVPAAKPTPAERLSEKKQEEEARRAEKARQQAEADVAKAVRELERAKVLESAARRDAERATFAVRRAEEALAASRQKLQTD